MREYLLVFVVAAVVTYAATPFVRWLAFASGAITAVRDRDIHTHPTPRLGGVAMLLGFIAALLVTLTIFTVIIATNAVNFIDGLDGLAAGVVAIAGLAFFSYSYLLSRTYDPPNVFSSATFITAALVGCCVGFLPHNFHPARLFMGDSGSLMLG